MRLWGDDQHRLFNNAQAAPYDFVGWVSTAATQAIFLLGRSTQRNWHPGTMALGLSHVCLTAWLAWLVVRRRALYVRYRELLATLGTFHYAVLDMHAALHADASPVAYHGGSALRLLALLSCSTPALFLALIALYGRLPLAWSALAQPLLALYPLAMSRRTCARVLASPGTAPLLGQLHDTLGFVHSAPLMAHVASSAHGAEADPMRECLAVCNYLIVMLVVVLPLAALRLNERRSRARFACTQRQAAEQLSATSSGDSWPEPDDPHRQRRRRRRQAGGAHQPSPALWCFQLYLQSCCCWAATCLVLRLPLPWLGGAAAGA